MSCFPDFVHDLLQLCNFSLFLFEKIEASIVTFEMSVNRTEAQLQTLESYFSTTASFTGTVNLDSSTPSSFPSPFGGLTVTTVTFNVPVTASPTSVTTMAQGYLNSANANNVSGTLIYSTIVENYNQVSYYFSVHYRFC